MHKIKQSSTFNFFAIMMVISHGALANSIETSIGSTISRDKGDEGLMLNISYIIDKLKFPIEFAIGFIQGAGDLEGA